jgi:hypothetical protein
MKIKNFLNNPKNPLPFRGEPACRQAGIQERGEMNYKCKSIYEINKKPR